jgi:predicted O-methyltransferase YrrM
MLNLKDNVIELSKITTDINEHLITMMNLVVERNAKKVVELGVRGGVSTQAWLGGVSQTGGFLNSYDIQNLLPLDGPRNTTIIERLGNLSDYKSIWNFEIGSSLEVHSRYTYDCIDILFIDTDHTAKQLYEELTLWHSKVKEDGIIVMHDVTVPNIDMRQGLMKFLSEHEEYIYDERINNNGLGFIRKE